MSAKKKIWITAIALVVVAVLVVGGIFLLNRNSKAKEISVEDAQTFVNEEFDKMASTDVSKLIAEKNSITVNGISYGTEKNVFLDCTIMTVDAHAAVSHFYDEFLSVEAKDEYGMYKSLSNLKKNFQPRLIELIDKAKPTGYSCTIQIFDTEDGWEIYAEPHVVEAAYGNLNEIKKDLENRTTYIDENGVEQLIGSTNVTKGLVKSFDLRYDGAKPETGGWLVKKYNTLKYDFERIFIQHGRWKTILDGLWVTLKLTFFALIIGILLGFVIAFIRCTADKLPKKNILLSLLNGISKLYISIIRGTPAMVQIMIIYFVIFMPMGVSKFTAAVVCFGLNSGAYVAEIVRGGIMSVDEGQAEAGRSLGFGYLRTMFYIIMPQAFKAVLPALANEFIVLLKETSIAFYIGLGDLMYSVNAIRAATYTQFMPLIAAALIYLVMVLVLSKLVSILERRLRNNER